MPTFKLSFTIATLSYTIVFLLSFSLSQQYRDIGKSSTELSIATITYFALKNKVRSKISKIINHPDYDGDYSGDDIALLELEKPVSLKEGIAIACMANDNPVEGDKVVISGWGFDENLKKPEILKWASLKIASRNQCEDYYREEFKADLQKHKIICASDKKKDVCVGDSGGPLIMNLDGKVTVVGIVSWGADCGQKIDGFFLDAPGIYTSVAKYQSWIKKNMQLD